jgi:hypothetical protein
MIPLKPYFPQRNLANILLMNTLPINHIYFIATRNKVPVLGVEMVLSTKSGLADKVLAWIPQPVG